MKSPLLIKLSIPVLVGAFLMSLSLGKGIAANDQEFIRELRLVSKQNSSAYQENLDAIVLKHIPLDTPADVGLKTCQANGFQSTRSKDMRGSDYPGFEEKIYCTQKKIRWYLLSAEEYRVILYIKNNKVGAAIGRFFIHSI